jgi:hypothetical protein
VSWTFTKLKPSSPHSTTTALQPKSKSTDTHAQQQARTHTSIVSSPSPSSLSFPLLLLMVLRLPFSNRQPWFDFLLDFSLKTKSKDTSSYLTILSLRFLSLWGVLHWVAELGSHGAQASQGAPSMLMCGDLDSGNNPPQPDSEFISVASSCFFYNLACNSVT